MSAKRSTPAPETVTMNLQEQSGNNLKKISVHSCIKRREIGNSFIFPRRHKRLEAATDALLLKKQLWSKLYTKSKHGRKVFPLKFTDTKYKGIFGLKYSPNGQYLVAACQNNALLIIDPLTNAVVLNKEKVHQKRCNTVSFIDDRLFATCSDDNTISIWDIRNMKENVMLLRGHTTWVKNIEYHKPSGQLVSSGFDNSVRAWNINNFNDGECTSKILLTCESLSRMRLASNGHSMYLTAGQGIDAIAIHNLNVSTLSEDVGKIDPSPNSHPKVVSCAKLPQECLSLPILKRNHVEIYRGHYHKNNDSFAVCSSLDVHPENSAIALRNDVFSDTSKVKSVSVHNTWSYYDGSLLGSNSWRSSEQTENNSLNPFDSYLPMRRGQPTNNLTLDDASNGKYIEEIAFSPCGNLIALPAGYGVQILAYDTKLTDYRTHIASRISAQHRWEDGDTVLPEYVCLEPKELATITFCFGHFSQVLCASFSPVHMQVASGSTKGQVLLHEVVL